MKPDPRRFYIAQGLPVPAWLENAPDPSAARARMLAQHRDAWRSTPAAQASQSQPRHDLRLDAEHSDPAAARARMIARNENAWRAPSPTPSASAARLDSADPRVDPYDSDAARARMTQRNADSWRGDSAHHANAGPAPHRSAPARSVSATPAQQLGPATIDAIMERVLGKLSPEAKAALRLDAANSASPSRALRYGEALPLRGYDFDE